MFTSTLRRASKRTFCSEKYNKLIEVNKKLELENEQLKKQLNYCDTMCVLSGCILICGVGFTIGTIMAAINDIFDDYKN